MAYCTQQDLIDRYGQAQLAAIADRDGTPGLDSGVVAKAIADAGAEIDSYIGERYRLPLAVVPAVLAGVAAAVALYRLHPAATPPDVRERYEDALRWLRDVATGKAGLGDVGEAAPAGAGALVSAPPRLFTHATLRGY